MRKKPKAEKIADSWRTFPHANSAREISDRYDDDRDEALEYTNSFDGNYNSKREIPDVYWDETTSRGGKYPVKPKLHDKKGGDTIRKLDKEEK